MIDKLIAALEVMRDNEKAGCSPVTADDVRRLLDSGNFNRNHDRDIDARMADDLRKLTVYHQRFRQSCVEFSIQRYSAHDPNDPDRFRRTRRQMIETGRDVLLTLSHIEPELRR